MGRGVALFVVVGVGVLEAVEDQKREPAEKDAVESFNRAVL